jgi:hypothetical protein
MMKPDWVEEVRKEIKRLNRKIDALNREVERGEADEIDALEDISNWSGWRDGLSWCLKMREGKATRKEAWGNKE